MPALAQDDRMAPGLFANRAHTGGRAFAAARARRKAGEIPAEFAPIAAEQSNASLAAMFGVSVATISTWRTRTGIRGQHRGTPATKGQFRPVPDDFAANVARMTQAELRHHYTVGSNVLARWFKDSGVAKVRWEPGGAKPLRPPPEDFSDRAAVMMRAELCRHYHASPKTVNRWLRETGTKAFTPPPKPKAAPFKRQAAPKPRVTWKLPGRAAVSHVRRDTSPEGQAAAVLRRYAPCYRCDQRGRMVDCEKRRTLWRYGNIVLTAAELIERARRKGFEADGWTEIAAVVEKPQSSRDAFARAGA